MAYKGSALYLGFDQGWCAHLGSSRGRLNSNLLGFTWLFSQVPIGFLAAPVLGSTGPMEGGILVLFLDMRQNP